MLLQSAGKSKGKEITPRDKTKRKEEPQARGSTLFERRKNRKDEGKTTYQEKKGGLTSEAKSHGKEKKGNPSLVLPRVTNNHYRRSMGLVVLKGGGNSAKKTERTSITPTARSYFEIPLGGFGP